MTSVSPVYPGNRLHARIRPGIYDIDFSKMSINSPGSSLPRRNSSALGAIPRDSRSSTPDSEVRTSRTPEPRLYRRNSISASMKKFRNKFTHVIDRLNDSFSEYIGEHREHSVAASSFSKSPRGKKSIEKILSSGGIRRNKNAPANSLLHSLKPKNLFKKRGNSNGRDVDTISRSSSCSSLPSIASVEYYHPVVPMETGSGRVLFYDDLEKSIVSHSFSENVYDDVNFTEKLEVRRSENPNFETNQLYRSENWVSRVSEVPEEINKKFMIHETLQSLNCSAEKSDESFESRSSCSEVVHPSWSNEHLENKEGDYVAIKGKCSCYMQGKEEAGRFDEDLEKANSPYVLSMYV